ncbi:hypothetical protein VNO80_11212 [Phaseolus coccineus]|uniref:Uncharacterized protein n=1 Tax=Phaseolus coccineus TaxID=3886 RepID=A0AAN9NA06_PHACN
MRTVKAQKMYESESIYTGHLFSYSPFQHLAMEYDFAAINHASYHDHLQWLLYFNLSLSLSRHSNISEFIFNDTALRKMKGEKNLLDNWVVHVISVVEGCQKASDYLCNNYMYLRKVEVSCKF